MTRAGFIPRKNNAEYFLDIQSLSEAGKIQGMTKMDLSLNFSEAKFAERRWNGREEFPELQGNLQQRMLAQ